MASANKRLELHHNLQEHMLFDNYLGLLYGSKAKNPGTKQIVHPSGDTSLVVIRSWGAFRVAVSETRHKSSIVTRSAIIGYEAESALPVLYLPDQRQPVKLCGNTRIEGNAKLPERGLERGYLAGKNYVNDQLIYGTQEKSEKYLPKLKSDNQNPGLEEFIGWTEKIDPFYKDSAFSFKEKTRLVSTVDPIHLETKIRGNIVLHSFDSIYVKATAHLENVILIAPVIRFEEGFTGNVQVIAHKRIVLEPKVNLNYPSTLILNELESNADGESNGIFLEEESQVLGGVLLVSQKMDFRRPVYLKVQNATIGGLVYNTGETELRGKVIGSLYTHSFRLRAGGGEYSNYLLDALISSDKLPKDFLYPMWLEDEKAGKGRIIQCF